MSLSASFIPSQWRRAVIVPLPNVPTPVVSSGYRPISITSVLSRMLERLVVRQFIYLSILNPPPGLIFADQFAFMPTGSTTAALITVLQSYDAVRVNPYVIVYALDFSKAFDSVRHSTLMDKMGRLQLPDSIYNWIAEFLGDHSHCTRFQGVMSSSETHLNSSVIQGSAIGPAAYLVNASDLPPRHIQTTNLKSFLTTCICWWLLLRRRRGSRRSIYRGDLGVEQ